VENFCCRLKSSHIRIFAFALAIAIHIGFFFVFLDSRLPAPVRTPQPQAISIRLVNVNKRVPDITRVIPPTAPKANSKKSFHKHSETPLRHPLISPNTALPPRSEPNKDKDDTNEVKDSGMSFGVLPEGIRRDIGRIHRELRKESPMRSHLGNNTSSTKLEKAIGAAAISRSVTMETTVSADGRTITKVKGPYGTYCLILESNSSSDGIDHTQIGVRSKQTSCPD
jgi:hypothetical protein